MSKINSHEFLTLNSIAPNTLEENINLLPSKQNSIFTENIDKELVINTLKQNLTDREYRIVYETIINSKKDIIIAKKFNVSRSTVCRVRNKAIQKLKQVIKEDL